MTLTRLAALGTLSRLRRGDARETTRSYLTPLPLAGEGGAQPAGLGG